MRWMAVWIAMALLTAGCVVDPEADAPEDVDAQAGDLPEEMPEPEVVTKTFTFEEEHDGVGLVSNFPQGTVWEQDWSTPTYTLLEGSFVLSWETPGMTYGLTVHEPDGGSQNYDAQEGADDQRIAADLESLENGEYVFEVWQGGTSRLPDTLTLEVTITYEIPATPATGDEAQEGSVSAGASSEGDVTVEQDGDRFVARKVVEGGVAEVASNVDLTLDTVNGAIEVLGDDRSGLDAQVDLWARAATEEEARRKLQAMTVTLDAAASDVLIDVDAPDWQDRGASITVVTSEDATYSGSADTTNGGILLDEILIDGFDADTTNGRVSGAVAAQGTLSADTTNGGIELVVQPVGPLELSMDTTNGGIDLALVESDQIAYTIEAATSNGDITESMDEAELEGDERSATLRTQDGAGRPIQVTGDTDTTNGRIHFTSASRMIDAGVPPILP